MKNLNIILLARLIPFNLLPTIFFFFLFLLKCPYSLPTPYYSPEREAQLQIGSGRFHAIITEYHAWTDPQKLFPLAIPSQT